MRKRAAPIGINVISSSISFLGASASGSTPHSPYRSIPHEGIFLPFAFIIKGTL